MHLSKTYICNKDQLQAVRRNARYVNKKQQGFK